MDFEKIRKIIHNELNTVAESEITPDSSFKDDLGADSIDMMNIIVALDEEFGTETDFEDDALTEIKTVQDAMNYMESILNK